MMRLVFSVCVMMVALSFGWFTNLLLFKNEGFVIDIVLSIEDVF